MPTAQHYEKLFDDLSEKGYSIIADFLPSQQTTALFDYAQSIPNQRWNAAAIGRQQQHTINTMVRRDRILWLSPEHEIEHQYLKVMDHLRVQLNRALFLGLFDYECHLAHYPKGAFYKKHLDAFKGRSNRQLTTVFYLNNDWQDDDGGQLVIYGERGSVLEVIKPQRGTLVVFLSDRFVHEVLPAQRDRLSITGWFRLNASISGIVDPPR